MNTKIAVIASHIHPVKQKHLLDWYQAFSKTNSNFKLFVGSKSKAIAYADNYKIYKKKDKIKYWFKSLLSLKIISKQKRNIQPLINYKPDIIHLLTSNVFANIEPLLDNSKTKLIVSFRGYDINVFPHLSKDNIGLTQRIFKKADVLHFISENLKETAINFGADVNKCVVINRSVDLLRNDDSFVTSLENRKPIIISVGRLVWEKGYLYALEVISILKKKGYEFDYKIIGSGTDYNNLIYHVNRLQIQDRVSFLGELPNSEVKQKMLASDIYFQPSLSEALSVALIEASSLGLPIVSSNIGGIPEVVQDGVTGYLCEVCNPEDYAKKIIKLLENQSLRKEMGEKAKHNVANKFSRTIEIDKWKRVYNSLE